MPRLYLRAFKSATKQIHLYNLNQNRAIRQASLRDQCYQHRFYGATDEVEEHLAILEDLMAPVLQAARDARALPPSGSSDRELLLSFVALQLIRTAAAAAQVNESTDKIIKQAFNQDPRLGEDLESWEVGYDNPALVALSTLPEMLYAISDLKLHLILARNNVFFTSDNPVFKYNQYCERVAQSVGVTGGLCRGLQMFLPLSPSLYLLVYDGTVYKVGDGRSDISYASDDDVERLNAIQIVGATENLFFSEWGLNHDIQRLLKKVGRYRVLPATLVREYGAEDSNHHSLLHSFQPMPNLRLSFSFTKIKRNARRVPLLNRVYDYRKLSPMPDLPVPPHLEGRTVRFTRLLASR